MRHLALATTLFAAGCGGLLALPDGGYAFSDGGAAAADGGARDAGDAIDAARELLLTSAPGIWEGTCPAGPDISFWRFDFQTRELVFEECRCTTAIATNCPAARASGQMLVSNESFDRLVAVLRGIRAPQPASCGADGPSISLEITGTQSLH